MSPESKSELRERGRRAGVAQGQVLVHSGLLDLVTLLAVCLGFAFLPELYNDAYAAAEEVLKVLLGVAATVFGLRALVRFGFFVSAT